MKKNLLILPQTLNFSLMEVNSWCNTRHHWIYASLSRMIRAGRLFRYAALCAQIDGVVPTCRLTCRKWASLFPVGKLEAFCWRLEELGPWLFFLSTMPLLKHDWTLTLPHSHSLSLFLQLLTMVSLPHPLFQSCSLVLKRPHPCAACHSETCSSVKASQNSLFLSHLHACSRAMAFRWNGDWWARQKDMIWSSINRPSMQMSQLA